MLDVRHTVGPVVKCRTWEQAGRAGKHGDWMMLIYESDTAFGGPSLLQKKKNPTKDTRCMMYSVSYNLSLLVRNAYISFLAFLFFSFFVLVLPLYQM